MSFLIRVQLPDRPGALGAVATALGKVGVDILSLDVVERRSGVAIDDLVVELPSGRLPDVLITAAESVEGVEVDAVRPWAGVLDTHRELELVEDVAADPAHGLQTFTDGVPKIIRAGWAIVLTTSQGKPQRVTASFAAPETVVADLPWWPLLLGPPAVARAGHRIGGHPAGQLGAGPADRPSGRTDVPRGGSCPSGTSRWNRRGGAAQLNSGFPSGPPALRMRCCDRHSGNGPEGLVDCPFVGIPGDAIHSWTIDVFDVSPVSPYDGYLK
jgi:hypothetical protein